MNVRKIATGLLTITLEWDAVPGAQGWRFYSQGVLRSRSFDPAKRTAKFRKGQEPYVVEAIVLTPIDKGQYPAAVPVPPTDPVAPRTYNEVVQNGFTVADARFCTTGLTRNERGLKFDKFSAYDDDGKDVDGGRSHTQVPGLPPANAMDNYGPCDSREWMGQTFPPWPPGSYER